MRAIHNTPSLVQPRSGEASQANAANSVQANAAVAGDVMVPKIAGAKVLRTRRTARPNCRAFEVRRGAAARRRGERLREGHRVAGRRLRVRTLLLRKP